MSLVAQATQLRHYIDTLITLFAQGGDSVTSAILDNINKQAALLEAMLLPLAGSARALQWVMAHHYHTLKTPLTPLYGYVQLLHEHPEQFGITMLTDEQKTHLMTTAAHAKQLWQTIDAAVARHRDTYAAQSIAAPDLLPPDEALAWVWPILHYTLHETAVKLVPQVSPGLPPVVYHPLHTTALLEYLVETVGREWMAYGPLVVRAQPEEARLALHIAAAGLRVTDGQWADLFAAHKREYYTRLLGMGGDVTQLTVPGEGGLSLHLPWANRARLSL